MKLSIATRMALQQERLDRKVKHQARMLAKKTKRAGLKANRWGFGRPSKQYRPNGKRECERRLRQGLCPA